MKKSTSFKISDEGKALLKELSTILCIPQNAVLEMLIRAFAKIMGVKT